MNLPHDEQETMNRQTSTFHVSSALVVASVCAFVFIGCEKVGPSPEPPRESPASYMNDPQFRQSVADARKELQAIAAERKPLADRMQELARQYGEDAGRLQNVPEWVALHKKVAALNKRYEETRKRQLATVHDRLAPQKPQTNTISK